MELETAKSKGIHFKIALAISIIRNKPENMSAKQFTQLIQLNFRESYKENKEIISQLQESLLKCKQENYLLKNEKTYETKSLISPPQPNQFIASSVTSTTLFPTFNNSIISQNYLNISHLSNKNNSNLAKNLIDIEQYTKMKQNYDLNFDFLLNLIKLKIIGKNFRLDENTETIIETLKNFLEQIKYFFFNNYKLNENMDVSCDPETNTTINDTYDSGINMSCNFDSTMNLSNESIKQQKEENLLLDENNDFNIYTFPYDSLVHALQIFLNVFQIEWLYYLRSNLLDSLNEFIENLVRFILESIETSKENRLKIECACQMLICLSGCDYLLDHIFRSILFGLQNFTSYLCDNSIDFNDKSNGLLLENSISLIECFDTIINLRNLSNYTKIDSYVKNDLKKFLNTIFVQLTDKYPILAIKMAKSMQLLNIKNAE